MVVRGGDDRFVGRAWAERVAGLLPRGRLVLVPREAHAVHYTRPELIAGIVRDLLCPRNESMKSATSSGASSIGTWPQDRRASRESGSVRCHSPAIRSGTRSSRSPQIRSVGARTAESSSRRSRLLETSPIPRASASGPVRAASAATMGKDARMS